MKHNYLLSAWYAIRSIFPPIISRHKICTVATLTVLNLLVYTFNYFYDVGRVKGDSMVPTINSGDIVVIYKKHSGIPFYIHRGDILSFRYPLDGSRYFVKRAVGLPGERVVIKDRKVYIDNNVIEEPYAFHNSARPDYRKAGKNIYTHRFNTDRLHVPEYGYFVLGDNRDASWDSRYWGLISPSDLEGRVVYILHL